MFLIWRSHCHFATTPLISPVALLTVAAPHSVALPFGSNLQPKVPAFWAAHCPVFTRYQPEPTGWFRRVALSVKRHENAVGFRIAVRASEIISAVRKLPGKQCLSYCQ